MLVVDGMTSVCEITQTKGLDVKVTLKAISEARNVYEPTLWAFQILKVVDNGTDRWFFRHNRDKQSFRNAS